MHNAGWVAVSVASVHVLFQLPSIMDQLSSHFLTILAAFSWTCTGLQLCLELTQDEVVFPNLWVLHNLQGQQNQTALANGRCKHSLMTALA